MTLALSLLLALGFAQEPPTPEGTEAASPETLPDPPETHTPTVLAISSLTYLTASLAHEGLGHLGGCALGGGTPLGFSTAVAGCDPPGDTPLGRALDPAGGAAGNLLVGGAFTWRLLRDPPSSGSVYYFEWLQSTVNLMQAGGYLMVGPWVPVGDWGTGGVLAEVDRPLPWQIGLSAAGLGVTFGSLLLANRLSEPLLGRTEPYRRQRQWRLTLPAYLFGSTLVTGSALMSRLGPEYAISAGVANFTGTLFLAYIPLFFSDDFFYRSDGPPPKYPMSIQRSVPWMVAGGALSLAAVAVFGPGVGDFPEPHPLFPGL